MIYLITYDKNVLLKNYDPLYKAIKSCGKSWWHHMNNTWLINTDLNASEIYNVLRHHISKQDKLMIIKIDARMPHFDYQGWLNEKAWEWIKNQNASGYNLL